MFLYYVPTNQLILLGSSVCDPVKNNSDIFLEM